MASLSELRRTKNELIAQKRNVKFVEQIKELAPAHLSGDVMLEFICECSDAKCSDRIPMELEDYQSLTRKPTNFLISPNHQHSDIEEVVKREADHTVVEKRAELIEELT